MTKKNVFFSLLTGALCLSFLSGLDFIFGKVLPYDRPSKPRNDTTFVVSSPTRIHQLIPSRKFVYDGVAYQTNALGFRDREFQREKPHDALRIAVLGDSFVEGMGEEQTNTIPKILERRLTNNPEKIEVMNCGVRGGSPAHYKYWLQSLLPYHPDVVVICLFDNDMDDDASILLKKAYYRADAYWNHSSPFVKKSFFLSRLQGELANLRFKLKRKQISRELFNEDDFNRDNKRTDGNLDAIGSNSVGYLKDPEGWRPHWARTKTNLDEIRLLLEENWIPVLFITIPGNEIVPLRPGLKGNFKRNYFSEWVEEWAKENNQAFVDLNQSIVAWYKRGSNPPLYQTTFSHFNAAGLTYASQLIEPELLRLISSISERS